MATLARTSTEQVTVIIDVGACGSVKLPVRYQSNWTARSSKARHSFPSSSSPAASACASFVSTARQQEWLHSTKSTRTSRSACSTWVVRVPAFCLPFRRTRTQHPQVCKWCADDPVATMEKLNAMLDKGVLSQAEFQGGGRGKGAPRRECDCYQGPRYNGGDLK
eukprot:3836317-Prymnesium_polylepis.1